MARGLFMDRPESLIIEEFESVLQEDQVRIRSEFSAIKHGTDLLILSGKAPYLYDMTFDSKLRMFIEKTPEESAAAQNSKRPFGNTTVGTVVETGSRITKFKIGDPVFLYGQIAETLIAHEDQVEHLPASMTPQDAVCMDPAFFAFAAVRDANVKPGDHVIVSGMGAIGLFIIQFLKLNGCLEIIAVDPMEKRRELAIQYGATAALDPTVCDVALETRKLLRGKGADTAIESSGHYRSLQDAIRCVHQCGKIVTLGFYKGKDQELMLGREWHHNRLTLISSMPVWGNPLRDHPLWDNDRLQETLKIMFSRRLISSEGIIDPIVPFDQSVEGILQVYRDPSHSIKLGVTYPKND